MNAIAFDVNSGLIRLAVLHWPSWCGMTCMAILIVSSLHAQGVASPYCAQYSDGTSLDCEFSSLQMCEQSVTGVGGVCINNPSGPNAISAPPSSVFGGGQPTFFAPAPPPPADLMSPQSPAGAQMQSLSSDLAINGGGDPPATLGAINFSGSGATCVGLLFRLRCGGS